MHDKKIQVAYVRPHGADPLSLSSYFHLEPNRPQPPCRHKWMAPNQSVTTLGLCIQEGNTTDEAVTSYKNEHLQLQSLEHQRHSYIPLYQRQFRN